MYLPAAFFAAFVAVFFVPLAIRGPLSCAAVRLFIGTAADLFEADAMLRSECCNQFHEFSHL